MTEKKWEPPDVIYMQIEDDYENKMDNPWVDEITWCSDRMHNSDVVYIRRDMVCVVNPTVKIEEPLYEPEDGDDN